MVYRRNGTISPLAVWNSNVLRGIGRSAGCLAHVSILANDDVLFVETTIHHPAWPAYAWRLHKYKSCTPGRYLNPLFSPLYESGNIATMSYKVTHVDRQWLCFNLLHADQVPSTNTVLDVLLCRTIT